MVDKYSKLASCLSPSSSATLCNGTNPRDGERKIEADRNAAARCSLCERSVAPGRGPKITDNASDRRVPLSS